MGEFLFKPDILVRNKRPYYICCYVLVSDGVCGAILIHHQHLVRPGEQPLVVQHGNKTTIQVPPVPMEQDKFNHLVRLENLPNDN